MNDILKIIFQTITGILSVIGLFCCLYYILCRNNKDLYIKGSSYLILDIDSIGDKLEYYVRKIQNDINNRYIYISRIVLYSKSLTVNNNENDTDGEIFNICRILAKEYSNIVFLGGKNNILSILSDIKE